MTISETTFGNTPAGMYLARELNDTNNRSLLRKVGAHITATNSAVRDIVNAYNAEVMLPKTAANCLRLLRREIAESVDSTDDTLVWKLTKNVRIGIIKRGIRLCTLARKAERVMANTHHRVNDITKYDTKHFHVTVYSFRDNNSGRVFEAGQLIQDKENKDEQTNSVNNFHIDDIGDTTAELLMERSNRRLERRGLKFSK